MKRETGALIDKAKRSVIAGKVLLRRGDPDFAASLAYYAMFYAVSALLSERGLHMDSPAAAHHAFAELFIKTGAFDPIYFHWLLDAHDRRIAGDYGIHTPMAPADVRQTLDRAQGFLLDVRRHIDLRRYLGRDPHGDLRPPVDRRPTPGEEYIRIRRKPS